MKAQKIFAFVALFVGVYTLTGCSKDAAKELLPFKIEKTYYEVMLRGSHDKISVENGSLDITLAVKDTNIISADYSKYPETNIGAIRIVGKQKGSTELTVIDNVTRESTNLVIKVTDIYLSCAFDKSNHPLLTTDVTLFLINNEARNFYLFRLNHLTHKLNDKPSYIGSYAFSVDKDSTNKPKPFLTLNYALDESGKPMAGEMTPKTQRFNIEESSQMAYMALESFLDVEWDNLEKEQSTKMASTLPTTFVLKEDSTGFSAQGELKIRPLIPDNILK